MAFLPWSKVRGKGAYQDLPLWRGGDKFMNDGHAKRAQVSDDTSDLSHKLFA
jgi:hypothetical protein